MKFELCNEDVFHLKSLLNDDDIMKVAFDKQAVWPFTVQEIIKNSAQDQATQTTNKQSTPLPIGDGFEFLNDNG